MKAIHCALDVEMELNFTAYDESGRARREEDMEDYELKNRAEAEVYYLESLKALKQAFPALKCCDALETGGCAHGIPCECGWLQAPWPWIVHRPGGRFCDCHLEHRRMWCPWDGPWAYKDARDGLGFSRCMHAQRGDGITGAPAPVCMPP